MPGLGDISRFVRGRLSGPGLGRRLARGAIWSMGINAGGAALGFLIQWLLARTLGVESYGVYVYVLAWMNVAVLVGRMEMDTAAIRFVGEYTGQNDLARLRGFLERSHVFVLSASLGLAGGGAILVQVLGDRLDPAAASAYLAAALLLPPTALLLLKSHTLQGFKLVPEAQAPRLLIRPTALGLGVLLVAYGFGIRIGATGAILLNSLATVLALAVAVFFLRRAKPPGLEAIEPKYEMKTWLSTAAGLVAIAGAQFVLSQQIDVLVVGTYLGTTDAGLYGVASQLSSMLGFAATAVIFVALPYITDLNAQGNRTELQRVVSLTITGTTALGVAGFLGLLFLGPFILGLFGEAFRDAYSVLVILIIGQLVSSSFGILSGFLMTLTGHHNQAGVVVAISAGLNLGLTIWLTPIYGPEGAAAATVATALLKAVVLAVASSRYLKIRVPWFVLKRPGSGR